MKEKEQKKNLTNSNGNVKLLDIIKTYISIIVLTHKNVGVLRILAAYFFVVFALICFWFTIYVPITSEFRLPTTGDEIISRLISGGMLIANFVAYRIMITWKHARSAPLFIRIAFIVLVVYINIWLISRVAYMLMQEGKFL
jgi:hypothetical protein